MNSSKDSAAILELIREFGSEEFVQKGRPQTHDDWMMTPTPIRINLIDASALHTILEKAHSANYRDIYFQSGDFIRGRLYKKRQILSDRRLTGTEVDALMDSLNPNASQKIYAGESSNGRYVLQDKANPNIKKGFRYSISTFASTLNDAIEIALRPIPEVPPSPKAIEISEALLRHVERMKKGLILLIGGTGEGKTSTIAAIMRHILERPSHMRILDFGRPVEYLWDKVKIHPSNQIVPYEVSETGTGSNMKSYEEAISTAMRKAPDWIGVTEMTDIESFRAAVEFATTGHIVSSTLHATSVESAYSRMYMKFPNEERAAMLDSIISETEILVAQTLYERVGGGLVAIREQLIQTPSVKERIKQAATVSLAELKREIRRCLVEQGTSYYQSAFKVFEKNLISQNTLEEVESVYGKYAS